MGTFVSLTILLVILLDPIGVSFAVPALLRNVPKERVRKVIVREMIFALIAMFLFLLVGNKLVAMLKLDPATLSISGAIVLFLIALGMVFPSLAHITSTAHPDDATKTEEPFIVPIAIPLIVGPSSISVILVNSTKFLDFQSGLLFALSIATAWAITFAFMFVSPSIMRVLGHRGGLALERLVGILLILISVQMFFDGLAQFSVKSASPEAPQSEAHTAPAE